MERDLFRLTLLQYDLDWEDVTVNLRRWEERILAWEGRSDLILLPEMFTTGFTMDPAPHAEGPGGRVSRFLHRMARATGAAVAGSLIVREKELYYNRLLFVTPEGEEHTYDKRHLFRMGGEHLHYAPGRERVTLRWRGVRIRPFICYDLRFPVWIRSRNEADLLLFVANWPAARRGVWTTLLAARALENQTYVAGVNRTGTDGRGITYEGESRIISPRGEVLARLGNEEGAVHAMLDMAALQAFREKFPVHLDADDYRLIL